MRAMLLLLLMRAALAFALLPPAPPVAPQPPQFSNPTRTQPVRFMHFVLFENENTAVCDKDWQSGPEDYCKRLGTLVFPQNAGPDALVVPASPRVVNAAETGLQCALDCAEIVQARQDVATQTTLTLFYAWLLLVIVLARWSELD